MEDVGPCGGEGARLWGGACVGVKVAPAVITDEGDDIVEEEEETLLFGDMTGSPLPSFAKRSWDTPLLVPLFDLSLEDSCKSRLPPWLRARSVGSLCSGWLDEIVGLGGPRFFVPPPWREWAGSGCLSVGE